MKHARLAAAAALLTSPLAALALTFTPGHFYSTSDSEINEYTSSGTWVSSLSSPEDDLRGLAFGSDGLLYVVHAGDPFSSPARVDALDASGSVVRSYAFAGSVWGNISYGKIGFDASGQNFYVGTADGLYRFDVAAPAGSLFMDVEAFDLEALPNGDLLVGSAYALSRYDGTGQLLGSISTLADPNGLTGDSSPYLVDVRGVEYDAATDTTFVTMLGYSGVVNMSFKVLALAGNSNVITGIEDYWYGDDMVVTDDGRLLVGSRTQAPGLFSTGLAYQGQFGGPDARFVTMLAVPEPPSALAWVLGLGVLALRAGRRVGA